MNNKLDKRLIFSFTVFDGCLEKRAIQLHLNCLKYYKDVFSKVLIVLLCDDVNDNKNIMKVEETFLSIGFRDIEFKIEECNMLYESQVFSDEIIDNCFNNDSITFFAHTKGTTNYERGFNKESIDSWIEGLWFYSLENMNEVDNLLVKDGRFTAYGPFRTKYYGIEEKSVRKNFEGRYYFSGNFFWVNPLRLYNDLITFRENVPNIIDRYYCELFWLYLYPENISEEKITSWDDYYVFENNPYEDSVKTVKYLNDNINCWEQFDTFKNKVEQNLNDL